MDAKDISAKGSGHKIEVLHGNRESVIYDPNMKIRLHINEVNDGFPFHWHASFEVITPLENSYTLCFDDQEILLEVGELIIIAPGILHSIRAPERGKRYILLFAPSIYTQVPGLETLPTMFAPFVYFDKSMPGVSEMTGIVADIYREYLSTDTLRFTAIYTDILRLLIAANRSRPQKLLLDTAKTDKHTNKYVDCFREICDDILNNCGQNLTAEQYAEQYGFSVSHFNRLFREITGTTFVAFLTSSRIEKAKYLLASAPELTVTNICYVAGFSSIATFNRQFKQYTKYSPTEYRKLQRI